MSGSIPNRSLREAGVNKDTVGQAQVTPGITPRLKVFISYSWNNIDARSLLVQKLQDAGIHTLIDEHRLRPSEHLGVGILDMLEEADALVAYLTPESIDSRHVLAELVRAHHQRLRIYPIIQGGATIDDSLWFLMNRVKITSTIATLSNDLDRLIDYLRKDQETLLALRSHSTIQRWHRVIADVINRHSVEDGTERWKNEVCKTILDNATEELTSLKNENYMSVIGENANYLMRAKPVFQEASCVYAVSLDTVSSFWVSSQKRHEDLAYDYLASQPPHTHRLFVCSSPESAHNYATVLNIHSRRYGAQGGVFLCGISQYIDMVQGHHLVQYENQWEAAGLDFAILEYGIGESARVYKATLNGELFHVVPRTSRRPFPRFDSDAIRRWFLELKELAPGELHSDWKIMKWEVDLQNRPDEWAGKLQCLFDRRPRDVFHLVLLANEHPTSPQEHSDFIRAVSDIKQKLHEVLEKEENTFRLKDFWFGESAQVSARDAVTDGTLNIGCSSPGRYLLYMRFADQDGLEQWYKDKSHSRLRRLLYETFSEEIVSEYSEMDKLLDFTNPAGKKKAESIHRKIETKASKHISRLDYLEMESLYDLVRRKPWRPRRSFRDLDTVPNDTFINP
ncbi:MAG: toll/interleukin-1 receptor domain-containing protein [Nitrospira sp.]